ncbi:MAG: DUF262 domain-containing protein [Hydrococcus sp. CRU_1_1]|nr:DUF262 domain-containing protein [Hydrococcus sp. CRU_1_1]
MASIESQDLSIDKLFHNFYIVPTYQREYVWQEEQVQEFFDDIYEEFENSPEGNLADYFIGSIIVCEKEKIYMKLLTVNKGLRQLSSYCVQLENVLIA